MRGGDAGRPPLMIVTPTKVDVEMGGDVAVSPDSGGQVSKPRRPSTSWMQL
jgi:hypothetical protein